MTTPLITRALVSDQVFRELCDAIVSGGYKAGEKLPTQRALAASLDVNMASVREAVKRLEQLGLVDVRHGDAMRVRDWRAQGGLDVIVHLLFAAGGLDRATLAAVLEARRLMLTEAARLAAERRSDEQAGRLVQMAERIAEEDDPAAAQLLDLEFMTELVEASHNVVFVLVLNTVRRLYLEHASLFSAVVADRDELSRLYGRAARAIRASSGGRAAAAIEHLAAAQEQRLLEALA